MFTVTYTTRNGRQLIRDYEDRAEALAQARRLASKHGYSNIKVWSAANRLISSVKA